MKIAIAQLNPKVGDLDGNLSKALGAAHDAASKGADLVIFPAHVLTGAPLEGLVSSAAFLADAEAHLQAFAEGCPTMALVSNITTLQPQAEDGEEPDDDELAVAPAVYIVGGGDAELLSVPLLAAEDEAPVVEIGGEQLAVLHEEHLAPEAELGGINVLVEMSADALSEPGACPAAWGTLDRPRAIAATCHSYLVDANLCGASDGMVFAGGSTVTDPTGRLLHACPLDQEEIFLFDSLAGSMAAAVDPKSAELNPNEILWKGLVVATRDYFAKNGFTDALLGVSGGIDSAVVATIAADALGAEHVHALMMPGRYSSEGSVTDAKKLCDNLGIRAVEIPIDRVVNAFEAELADVCDGGVSGVAAENLQARVRAVYLMTVSNTFGWPVLNTGNKSEAAMGFSTLFGDTCGVFAPIGDLYKTDVYDLAEWRVAQGASIPTESIEKAPSAELYPGAADADRLPPYEELDDILFDHVESNMDAGELIHEGHERELVERVLAGVRASEFKRRLEPMAPKVEGKSFAERAWPVTNGWEDDSYDAFEAD